MAGPPLQSKALEALVRQRREAKAEQARRLKDIDDQLARDQQALEDAQAQENEQILKLQRDDQRCSDEMQTARETCESRESKANSTARTETAALQDQIRRVEAKRVRDIADFERERDERIKTLQGQRDELDKAIQRIKDGQVLLEADIEDSRDDMQHPHNSAPSSLPPKETDQAEQANTTRAAFPSHESSERFQKRIVHNDGRFDASRRQITQAKASDHTFDMLPLDASSVQHNESGGGGGGGGEPPRSNLLRQQAYQDHEPSSEKTTAASSSPRSRKPKSNPKTSAKDTIQPTGNSASSDADIGSATEGRSFSDLFPTVVYVDGHWRELECYVCSSNRTIDDNKQPFKGLPGLRMHVRLCHGISDWRPILPKCFKRTFSLQGVQPMFKGRHPNPPIELTYGDVDRRHLPGEGIARASRLVEGELPEEEVEDMSKEEEEYSDHDIHETTGRVLNMDERESSPVAEHAESQHRRRDSPSALLNTEISSRPAEYSAENHANAAPTVMSGGTPERATAIRIHANPKAHSNDGFSVPDMHNWSSHLEDMFLDGGVPHPPKNHIRPEKSLQLPNRALKSRRNSRRRPRSDAAGKPAAINVNILHRDYPSTAFLGGTWCQISCKHCRANAFRKMGVLKSCHGLTELRHHVEDIHHLHVELQNFADWCEYTPLPHEDVSRIRRNDRAPLQTQFVPYTGDPIGDLSKPTHFVDQSSNYSNPRPALQNPSRDPHSFRSAKAPTLSVNTSITPAPFTQSAGPRVESGDFSEVCTGKLRSPVHRSLYDWTETKRDHALGGRIDTRPENVAAARRDYTNRLPATPLDNSPRVLHTSSLVPHNGDVTLDTAAAPGRRRPRSRSSPPPVDSFLDTERSPPAKRYKKSEMPQGVEGFYKKYLN